jgi:hypothetical protein
VTWLKRVIFIISSSRISNLKFLLKIISSQINYSNVEKIMYFAGYGAPEWEQIFCVVCVLSSI